MVHVSNFDNPIADYENSKEEIESALSRGESIAHTAWEFYGTVEKQGSIYRETVKRYGSVIDVIDGPSFVDVIKAVNNEYGWE